jgi:sugar phosphate isomerase/epimerase
VTTPGIPNDYSLSTMCFGTRLTSIQDQIFAAVGMGFRRIELGLAAAPPSMDGLEDSQRETGVQIPSMVVGCRDAVNGSLSAQHLGSRVEEECDRAINAVRRHVRLARSWGCPTIVVRGLKLSDPTLRREGEALAQRLDRVPSEDDDEALAFVKRAAKKSQRQIEQVCRSLHLLTQEFPDVVFAIEPAREIEDLFSLQSVEWILGDLAGLRYWHNVGNAHRREQRELEDHGKWLESFGHRMVGVHLQDACPQELEMPLGTGEVDFKLLGDYLPQAAEKVLEIGPRHGRAEILASVQFLLDHGF